MTRRLPPILLLLSALGLAACNSTADVLEPSAITSETKTGTVTSDAGTATAAVAAGGTGTQASTATGDSTAGTRIAAAKSLQFAPVVGTPVEAAGPLSERLNQQARAKGFKLTRTGEPTGHILKGYFSALPEGSETTVVYVWDVLDAGGNRLHRIQGKQVAKGGDGWPSITPAVMQGIADTTIDQLAVWFGNQTG